jgi:hypothetical protein
MSIDWGSFVSTWELEGTGGKTRLTFAHSGFDEGRPPRGAWMGWPAGVSALRRYHELRDWRPIWLSNDTPGVPEGFIAAP